MLEDPFWCSTCVTMSTRPRIQFDSSGRCSACQWREYKEKQIDWMARWSSLESLCHGHRNKDSYDCIVAVSGGKDGSYVSYNLKKRLNMNPLTVTVRPAMETYLGQKNLSRFVDSGFANILISPDPEAMKTLNRIGLSEMGFSYYGWLIAIHSAVLKVALQFSIPLVFYSEDGECEYGGDMQLKDNGIYGVDYMLSRYMEAGYDRVLRNSGLSDSQLYWFTMPNQADLDKIDLKVTHWGFFESWDPYRNYLVAKEHCGLQESDESNVGTFTNFAQTDQDLYPLHVYLMYLKYGFGRATQDAGIDVRRGAMSRAQAVQLVKMYDDFYPEEYFESWCQYYGIGREDLLEVFDRWANRDLFKKVNGRWLAKFEIR